MSLLFLEVKPYDFECTPITAALKRTLIADLNLKTNYPSLLKKPLQGQDNSKKFLYLPQYLQLLR